MEVSALKYSGSLGLHGRSRLLRLQTDERLIAFLRRGNTGAFEVLVGRYESRLLAFCRHLLGSREDAEDVLQEVMAAAFNAILADERPINVRPWLYRIARNRSLNHLRRAQAIAVDSMDQQLSDHGASAADKVQDQEEFRLLVGDIHELPETQKTALVLREMDALSYEQIAEAMETTVPSVKSLLVRARVSLAEASEARLLSCDEVRIELGEVAEGLIRRPSPLVRRHLRNCKRCTMFRTQLKHTNKALAALLPVGPAILLKKLLIVHLGHSAGAGSSATAAGSGAAGAAGAGSALAGAGSALAGSSLVAGSGGFVSAGIGALAAKTAAGLAAAALVTGAAVEAGHHSAAHRAQHPRSPVAAASSEPAPAAEPASVTPLYTRPEPRSIVRVRPQPPAARPSAMHRVSSTATGAAKVRTAELARPPVPQPTFKTPAVKAPLAQLLASARPPAAPAILPGRTQTQSDPTVLPPTPTPSGAPAGSAPGAGGQAAPLGGPTTPAGTPGTGSATTSPSGTPAGGTTTGPAPAPVAGGPPLRRASPAPSLRPVVRHREPPSMGRHPQRFTRVSVGHGGPSTHRRIAVRVGP